MDDSNTSNVSWGSAIKGAAIAGGAVAVIAIFPASLGAVGGFVAANPLLTVGAAALAGGIATKNTTAKPSRPYTEEENMRRLEARMEENIQAAGLSGSAHGR